LTGARRTPAWNESTAARRHAGFHRLARGREGLAGTGSYRESHAGEAAAKHVGTTKMRLLAVFGMALALAGAALADKPTFTVGWSIYVGWNPYYYMNKSGILKKWADKYGVAIKVQRFDYAPSLDAFVAQNIEACAMTNMEALDMPAAAGIDTTAIIVGDYSNGNDAVLTRNGVKLKD